MSMYTLIKTFSSLILSKGQNEQRVRSTKISEIFKHAVFHLSQIAIVQRIVTIQNFKKYIFSLLHLCVILWQKQYTVGVVF